LIDLSEVFASQIVGCSEVDEGIWLISLMKHDLGFFDAEERRVELAEKPFIPEKA
tara:strand:+ start:1997 stop:2161 length:165 start_codon:yes stop_codon:yes gene_type:complete